MSHKELGLSGSPVLNAGWAPVRPAFLCTQPFLSFANVGMFLLSQGSEDSEDEVETLVVAADAQEKPEARGTLSSDEDVESCPICLNVFRDQAVGTPETCAHYFCLDCIVEWSRVSQLLMGLLSPQDAPTLAASCSILPVALLFCLVSPAA